MGHLPEKRMPARVTPVYSPPLSREQRRRREYLIHSRRPVERIRLSDSCLAALPLPQFVILTAILLSKILWLSSIYTTTCLNYRLLWCDCSPQLARTIPLFTRELDGPTFHKWIEKAVHVAVANKWTDAEKLQIFQERLARPASAFNDGLRANQKDTLKHWRESSKPHNSSRCPNQQYPTIGSQPNELTQLVNSGPHPSAPTLQLIEQQPESRFQFEPVSRAAVDRQARHAQQHQIPYPIQIPLYSNQWIITVG